MNLDNLNLSREHHHSDNHLDNGLVHPDIIDPHHLLNDIDQEVLNVSEEDGGDLLHNTALLGEKRNSSHLQEENLPSMEVKARKVSKCFCRHVICDGLRVEDQRTPFVARATRNAHEKKMVNHEMCPVECQKCKEHLLDPNKKIEGAMIALKTEETCTHTGCSKSFAKKSSRKRHEANSSLHRFCDQPCRGCEGINERDRKIREATERCINTFRDFVSDTNRDYNVFTRDTFEQAASNVRNHSIQEKHRFFVVDLSSGKLALLRDVVTQIADIEES